MTRNVSKIQKREKRIGNGKVYAKNMEVKSKIKSVGNWEVNGK
jgi:hypothetical protein